MDMTPKPQSTKVKIGKWDYIKPKKLLHCKKKKKKKIKSEKATYRTGENSCTPYV